MSNTHQWAVQISAGQVIGNIHPSSLFFTGPFAPGSTETVMYLAVENTGDTDGNIFWRLYEYPGDAMEQLIDYGVISCAVGAAPCIVGNINATMPSGITTYPLGVKVWGEDESEPSWGQMGTFMWGQPEMYIIA